MNNEVWPRLLSQDQAAAYLSIGRSSFINKIKPLLTPIYIEKIMRFDRQDLDNYIDTLKLEDTDQVISTTEPRKAPSCQKEPLALNVAPVSGISKKCIEVNLFGKAVEQARLKRPRNT